MASTLVEELQSLNDARLGVWANKVEIPLVVDASFPAGTDEIVEIDGKKYRHISPDVIGDTPVDTDPGICWIANKLDRIACDVQP